MCAVHNLWFSLRIVVRGCIYNTCMYWIFSKLYDIGNKATAAAVCYNSSLSTLCVVLHI